MIWLWLITYLFAGFSVVWLLDEGYEFKTWHYPLVVLTWPAMTVISFFNWRKEEIFVPMEEDWSDQRPSHSIHGYAGLEDEEWEAIMDNEPFDDLIDDGEEDDPRIPQRPASPFE